MTTDVAARPHAATTVAVSAPFSSADVCSLFRITRRQLGHWIAAGLIHPTNPPSGSGSRVGFSAEDLDEIADVVSRINACPLHH